MFGKLCTATTVISRILTLNYLNYIVCHTETPEVFPCDESSGRVTLSTLVMERMFVVQLYNDIRMVLLQKPYSVSVLISVLYSGPKFLALHAHIK